MSFYLKKKHTYRPINPEIDTANSIGKKIDMYVPLHNNDRRDVVGGIQTTEDSASTLAGSRGISAEYNPVDDFTNYGNVHSIGTGSLFFSVWFKTTQTVNGGIVCKSFYGGAASRFYLAAVDPNLDFVLTDASDVVYRISIANTWSDDKWHMATCVYYRGVGTELYVDGVSVGSASFTALQDITTTFSLLLGSYNDEVNGTTAHASAYQWSGELSDFILGHHSISSEDVKSLYNNFYQILKPKKQFIPVIITATTGFQAVWAAQANITMGFK